MFPDEEEISEPPGEQEGKGTMPENIATAAAYGMSRGGNNVKKSHQ
jgi:hypothetical protein